jgi:hypothetical protein
VARQGRRSHLHRARPRRGVSIVNSTFEGNSGIDGGALASMGISRMVINGMFKNNSAIGHDENPARIGPEGGGIYNDGDNWGWPG